MRRTVLLGLLFAGLMAGFVAASGVSAAASDEGSYVQQQADTTP